MKRKINEDNKKIWIEGIEGWSSNEKASSVHAALEAALKVIGEDITYEYLIGVSSLAFRMQVGGLCPSSPHPGCGYNCIERSLKAIPWNIGGYSIDQYDKNNSKEVVDAIVGKINDGIPVLTSEEEDGIIIGYLKDKSGFLMLHPWKNDGIKPVVVKSLAKVCWGVGFFTTQKIEKIDQKNLIIDSLKQAVKMSKTKKAENYDVGFNAWDQYIKLLINLGDKMDDEGSIIGNVWIYKSLIHNRRIACKYLTSIKNLFNDDAKGHLTTASNLYSKMSEEILTFNTGFENVTGGCESLKESLRWTREHYQDQVLRLEKALPLEIQAIGELQEALQFI